MTIESVATDGKISRTVYDDKGRTIWSDDAHLPGQATAGTHTVYDKLDRVVRTERYASVAIDLVDDPAWPGKKRSVLALCDVHHNIFVK